MNCLEKIYEASTIKNQEEAVYEIFQIFTELYDKEDFDSCILILKEIDLDKISITMMVGLLAITNYAIRQIIDPNSEPVKPKLEPYRKHLLDKMFEFVKKKEGTKRANALFGGFKYQYEPINTCEPIDWYFWSRVTKMMNWWRKFLAVICP